MIKKQLNWESLERALFFWSRTEWIAFSFTTNYETWLVLDLKPIPFEIMLDFFPLWHVLMAHWSLLPGSWLLFSTLCPQTDHVSWANAASAKSSGDWLQPVWPHQAPSKLKWKFLVGASWFWMHKWLSPTFPFISIISATLLWFSKLFS